MLVEGGGGRGGGEGGGGVTRVWSGGWVITVVIPIALRGLQWIDHSSHQANWTLIR